MVNFKVSDSFFQNHTKFFGSYFNKQQFLTDLNSTEIVLLGRSNVGKSSLINAIGMNKNLAYTSKRPGCTVSVNFFKIDNPKNLFLVDLPGYGYAKRSEKDIKKVTSLITDYIMDRMELKKVYLLIDSRMGIQESDAEFINFFNKSNIRYQIVLTKIDKIKKKELEELESLLKTFFYSYTNVDSVISKVSSKDGVGLSELRNSIYKEFLSCE